MKKSFLMIVCMICSMAVFAQTPATSGKAKAAQSEQVKKEQAATQNSKETLAKDKSQKKPGATKHAYAKTKKAGNEHVKADKATVRASKQTEKKSKKTAAKPKPASGSASSLSTPPRQ